MPMSLQPAPSSRSHSLSSPQWMHNCEEWGSTDRKRMPFPQFQHRSVKNGKERQTLTRRLCSRLQEVLSFFSVIRCLNCLNTLLELPFSCHASVHFYTLYTLFFFSFLGQTTPNKTRSHTEHLPKSRTLLCVYVHL